jgi:hypothetical protein
MPLRHRADDADLPDHRDSAAERSEFLEERHREPCQFTVSGQIPTYTWNLAVSGSACCVTCNTSSASATTAASPTRPDN